MGRCRIQLARSIPVIEAAGAEGNGHGIDDRRTYIIIEVVDDFGTRNSNANTSNGVDNSLVLRSPVCYPFPKARGRVDGNDRWLARRH